MGLKQINETSIAINKGEIELLYVFIKNRDNMEEFSKSYKYNNKVNLLDYIDEVEFEKIFNNKIKNKVVYGRALEATYTFIQVIKETYNIDIINLSDKEFIKFLRDYIKEFPNMEAFLKLNVYNWGIRSIEVKSAALNNLIKSVNRIK